MGFKKGIMLRVFSHSREKRSFEYDIRLMALMQKKKKGKSSHMTSLPQHELSEGFENVNFLKNDKKINK